jgi:hypothetical protein
VSLPIQKSTVRTTPLLIHKSAAKLCRCQFRNWQPIGQLLNQKSAAKNCAAADSKIGSDGGVISIYFFFFGVYT